MNQRPCHFPPCGATVSAAVVGPQTLFSTSCYWRFRRWVVFDSLRPWGLWPTILLCPWNSPGKNTRVGCHALLQGIFLTQGLNSCLLCFQHWQVDSLPQNHLKKSFQPVEMQKDIGQGSLLPNYPSDNVIYLTSAHISLERSGSWTDLDRKLSWKMSWVGQPPAKYVSILWKKEHSLGFIASFSATITWWCNVFYVSLPYIYKHWPSMSVLLQLYFEIQAITSAHGTELFMIWPHLSIQIVCIPVLKTCCINTRQLRLIQ